MEHVEGIFKIILVVTEPILFYAVFFGVLYFIGAKTTILDKAFESAYHAQILGALVIFPLVAIPFLWQYFLLFLQKKSKK